MTYTGKRAWIYSRIDAPEDEHGALKGQEKELVEYARQIELQVFGISSDLGSGTDFNRPGLLRLTAAAQRGEFDVLLIKSTSRLGRDAHRTFTFIEQLGALGVSVFSPLEGEIKPATPLRNDPNREKNWRAGS